MPDARESAGTDAAYRLEVVLPCLDEAGALPSVLTALPRGARALVVDNGSSDGSAHVARAHGARVVAEPQAGYGSACHRGLTSATAPLVGFADADGTMDLAQLTAMAELIESDAADLVIARRRPEPGAMAWHLRVANAILAAAVSAVAGQRIHDLGPMRVARRSDLLTLDLQDRRSGYPLETLVAAARAGWRIVEVDTAYRARIGHSKVTGTARGTAQAVWDMLRVLWGVRAARGRS